MTVLMKIGGTENDNRTGDIIFVHGLNGDAKATWSTHAHEDTFWPVWFAQDCPSFGIWSIGYDVAASGWKGTAMPLFDRANNILAELSAEQLGSKPICFIAHSMGGLLVKQMLRNAESLASEFHAFCKAVRGIIFLATPHTGSDLARLTNYWGFFLRPTVAIEELQREAAALRDLNMWYRHNADRLSIKTQVYFETQKTQGFQVVDVVSADPGIKDVVPIGIDANHLTIAKPPSKDSLVYKRSKQFATEVLLQKEEDQTTPRTMKQGEKPKQTSSTNSAPSFAPIVYPRPFLVPPLPVQSVIGRDKLLADISTRLALFDTMAKEISPVALRGMGGVGKTTLALAVGRQEGIRASFPDGVLWVEVGPHPLLRQLLNDWGRALGVDLIPERDEKACQERLRDLLSERQVLIIVDDVWEEEHGSIFHIAGPHCRLLFTTRESSVAHALATRTRSIRVDVLSPDDALTLLGTLVPEVVTSDQKTARRLCEKLEFLPLALKLAGQFLANEADVPHRMRRLADELTEQRASRLSLIQREGRKGLDEHEVVSLRDILSLSVHRLSTLDQERFAQLAVFGGEPLTWEVEAASYVWECSRDEAERTTSQLIRRGLVEPRFGVGERYWMHALLADYATDLLEEMET